MELPKIKELATEKTDSTTISYFKLRQLIGILGILLPFALVIFGGQLQPSLSHYYYSFSHIIFVGTLCALSTFLITYKGVYRLENWLANIAGFCAAGVALFPTNVKGFIGFQFLNIPTWAETSKVFNILHYSFATTLFICFAIFCLVIFQKPDKNKVIDKMKVRRNRIYRICSYLMIFSILAIAFLSFFHQLDFPYSTLIFESTTLIPFGISWLVKGSYNWKDSSYSLLDVLVSPFR
jgi:hypothetical protein